MCMSAWIDVSLIGWLQVNLAIRVSKKQNLLYSSSPLNANTLLEMHSCRKLNQTNTQTN